MKIAGSWNIVDTITITIDNKDIICKDSNTQDIRTIEFRTKKKVIIWFKGSRLGILYQLDQS